MRIIETDTGRALEHNGQTVDLPALPVDAVVHGYNTPQGLWAGVQEAGKPRPVYEGSGGVKLGEIDLPADPEAVRQKAVEARQGEVEALRDAKIAEGMLYQFPDSTGTIQLRSDTDLRNVQGVASSGQSLVISGDASTTLTFRDQENSTHQLTGQQAVDMGLAVSQYVTAHYEACWGHKGALANSADPDAHDITTGWPS